jgi:hypothetical protein
VIRRRTELLGVVEPAVRATTTVTSAVDLLAALTKR